MDDDHDEAGDEVDVKYNGADVAGRVFQLFCLLDDGVGLRVGTACVYLRGLYLESQLFVLPGLVAVDWDHLLQVDEDITRPLALLVSFRTQRKELRTYLLLNFITSLSIWLLQAVGLITTNLRELFRRLLFFVLALHPIVEKCSLQHSD